MVELSKPTEKLYFVKRKTMRDSGPAARVRMEEREVDDGRKKIKTTVTRTKYKQRGLSKPSSGLEKLKVAREIQRLERAEPEMQSTEELKERKRLALKGLTPSEKKRLKEEEEAEEEGVNIRRRAQLALPVLAQDQLDALARLPADTAAALITAMAGHPAFGAPVGLAAPHVPAAGLAAPHIPAPLLPAAATPPTPPPARAPSPIPLGPVITPLEDLFFPGIMSGPARSTRIQALRSLTGATKDVKWKTIKAQLEGMSSAQLRASLASTGRHPPAFEKMVVKLINQKAAQEGTTPVAGTPAHVVVSPPFGSTGLGLKFKKGRGRPKGAKNKPKGGGLPEEPLPPTPPEIMEYLSQHYPSSTLIERRRAMRLLGGVPDFAHVDNRLNGQPRGQNTVWVKGAGIFSDLFSKAKDAVKKGVGAVVDKIKDDPLAALKKGFSLAQQAKGKYEGWKRPGKTGGPFADLGEKKGGKIKLSAQLRVGK